MGNNAPEFVKYIGISAVRQIRDFEWRAAGVKGQDSLVWSDLNGWTVSGDKLNSDALKVLREDDGFAFIGREEQSEEEVEDEDETE